MRVVETVDQIRAIRQTLGGTIALVPTMGAIHDGHRRLIEAARTDADRVWVSIFVNPTQFGAGEDYDSYPRPIDSDLDACRAAGADLAFCPTASQMYPPDATACQVTVPDLATVLEGEHRPGHFDGVCLVVAKLLNIIQPHVACFGQKDYQQLRVIEAMVDDLLMPVRISGIPTVREADGLAMSSRNAYLTEDQRRHATALYKALTEARRLVEDAGESDPTAVESAMRHVMEAHHFDVDYAALRHPRTLQPLDCIEPRLTHGVIALTAARLGDVRLIDNMLLGAVASQNDNTESKSADAA